MWLTPFLHLDSTVAAARLAKDTSSSQVTTETGLAEFTTKDGSTPIAMHTVGHEFDLKEHKHKEGDGQEDHACIHKDKIIEVWAEIAAEHEVHLIVVKDRNAESDSKLDMIQNRDLIPLTGAKTYGQEELCFTSWGNIAVCAIFSDNHCNEENNSDDLVTVLFPHLLNVTGPFTN